MGASFHASVAVGVPLRDIAEVRVLETTETRYNERTGQPYEKKRRRAAVFIFSVEVPELAKVAEESPGEWEGYLGLSVFTDRREQDELATAFVGVGVVKGDPEYGGPITEVECQKLLEAEVQVCEKLAALRERVGGGLPCRTS